MTVDFVRFNASDGVELQGWMSDPGGDEAVVHIHGMSGNGYENHFLDNLRQYYFDKGIAFFSIDTRGRGIISDFKRADASIHGGSCFELFDDSVYDIEGAINYLQSVTHNKKRIILEGHSLGCTKVVNYWLTKSAHHVTSIILLAPTDMVGWVKTEPRHDEFVVKARKLLAEGMGEALVDAQCWIDKTPISAQTYVTICLKDSSADIYSERPGGAHIGRIGIPMLIVYGTQDIGILEIDGTIGAWKERVDRIKNSNTGIAIIEGATHNFLGFEQGIVQAVDSFIQHS